jgi:hypothetical protein
MLSNIFIVRYKLVILKRLLLLSLIIYNIIRLNNLDLLGVN